MINLDGIYKSYGDNKVIENFTKSFERDKIYFITGKSGIGKTTLSRIMLGLERADKGTVRISDSIKKSAVLQEDALCGNMTVYMNIKVVSVADDKEVDFYLEKSGLNRYKNSRVKELSGGMKRRVSILRAILSDFDFIVMDEPFKGLDYETKMIMMDIVIRFLEGKCTVIITHDEKEIKYFEKNYRISKIETLAF